MLTLLKEIRILIALNFDDVFYKLYITDPDVAEYARTNAGKYAYQKLAIKEEILPCKTEYKLFGKLHNIDDMPAIVYPERRVSLDEMLMMRDVVEEIEDDEERKAKMFDLACINGAKLWYRNDLRHRDGDLPAIAMYDMRNDKYTYTWYKDGMVHREGDLPACIWSDGSQEYYKNNKVHRDGDLPAIITERHSIWIKNGMIHREGDLPAIINKDGTQEWYINDERHRDGDKPAIFSEYQQEWWFNGEKHREDDKPAVVGSGHREWYVHHKFIRVEFDTPITTANFNVNGCHQYPII